MTNKPKKVLILGSGGLSIGQAGEFDYSGSQAIKALKQEGIRTVLINPNIATIQTSQNLSDRVYFLPVTKDFVLKIIKKENPDGILISFGGQTALNCGVELFKEKILEQYDVKILGTPIESVIVTEDREAFSKFLKNINIKTPRSTAIDSFEKLDEIILKIGFPVIVRAAYALGGLGSGFCNNREELEDTIKKALANSNQVLIEESLKGWKEIEYEVMRDAFDNCITICNMENMYPLGIHTGESIVVAPSQTLTDREYHQLRKIAIHVIKALNIVGECNIQFAVDPKTCDYRVIEVNARLSRSSALASKATGYPLAYVAAKLSLGYKLKDITNPITKNTTAYFEPALDYIAVKFPRWDTDKFRTPKEFLKSSLELGSSMKSVGEVMAIGRTFEEALQKAIRMSKDSYLGLIQDDINFTDPIYELAHPSHQRIFAIAKEIKLGRSIEEIHTITAIDQWFLYKLKNIIDLDTELDNCTIDSIPDDLLRRMKVYGFSDKQIAKHLMGKASIENELLIRKKRISLKIVPVVKQIDTLAAEFPAQTNYLYLTYNGQESDLKNPDPAYIILGSGAYSIGSSVEFDWSCVTCVKTLRQAGYTTVVINYNPETVSTDYDESDRLYFEELSYERVMDIVEKENPKGVIVSFGGQIPNKLAMLLDKSCVPIMGTSVNEIDRAEERNKFSKLLDQLNVDQPPWIELSSIDKINNFATRVGYPVLIRPSYVLSGAAMHVAYNKNDLYDKLKKASKVSEEYPVVISKFIIDAKEIEMDCVAQNGDIIIYAISEHIENAGVHSGDSTLVTPAQKLFLETIRRIKKITHQIIKALNVTGPVNIQYLAKDNKISVIECNLRASRTLPFVSKVYKINFVELATKAIIGLPVSKVSTKAFDLDYLGVKAPQFSFTRLRGADPILGVEMTSTGEVACLGEELPEAFLKALLATGFKLPKEKTILLSTGNVELKSKFLPSVRKLSEMGYTLFGTEGTANFYELNGIKINILHWPLDSRKPNVLDFLQNRQIDIVINIPKNNEEQELNNDYLIRRTAVDYSIPLITNLQVSILLVEALSTTNIEELLIKAWDEY
ncbi:MAG: carbamoyl-phosphate synthase (glutamine-hydrolyzing) large subunit [Candidatus Thorarchaeota archaeon]